MKSPRKRLVWVIALSSLFTAGLAQAAPTISLVWSDTSGAGTPGSSDISAAVSDVLTLDVVVNIDEDGFSLAQMSIAFDGNRLLANTAEECPAPPNSSPGLCQSTSGVFFLPMTPGAVISNAGASSTITNFDVASFGSEFLPSQLVIGRATFIVNDATGSVVSLAPLPGIDGIIDGFLNFVVPPIAVATVNGGTSSDSDGDGLSDADETGLYGTDPLNPDTDGDGISDGVEVLDGTDVLNADTDGDGLSDGEEVSMGTNPLVTDTDGDGIADGDELSAGTDPLLSDSDADGIADGSDPDWVANAVASLPATVFAGGGKGAGRKNAMLSQLAAIEARIADGSIADAISSLRNLGRKIDGCGTSADRNDWIGDCASQIEVRDRMDLLRKNLGSS